MSRRPSSGWTGCVFRPWDAVVLTAQGADADYALTSATEYLSRVNDEVFLALQVEDKECVECVESIAALPGVDLLFVGPADLSISYGVPFQFGHPLVQSAITRVARGRARRVSGGACPRVRPSRLATPSIVGRT